MMSVLRLYLLTAIRGEIVQIIKNLTYRSDFGSIVYDKYLPDNAKGVVIQIAHGMIEHRGRYEWLCRCFAQHGYIVVINDHRGHGDSVGGAVWHGEMGDNGFEKAVQDMLMLHTISAAEFADCKHVLLSHSMGSLLARSFMQCYQNKIDGVILCGTPAPGYFLAFGQPVLKLLLKAGLQVMPKITDLFSYNMKFKLCKKGKGYWACSDQQVVKDYLQDKKCQFRFSVNSLYWLCSGMQQVFSCWSDRPENPDFPILFLSGELDACGNFTKGIIKASEHLRSQGYRNISLTIYPHVRHEIFNEPNKLEIFADTLKWLDSQGL